MVIAESFGLKCAKFPNDPLGSKMNLSLRYAWQQSEYNYLMQLGSDDLMMDEGVLFTTAYMRQGVEIFGFTGTYIIEYETLKCKIHEGSTVWGSGRFIHSRIVNDLKCKLWTSTINKGLDNDSRARIASNCRAKPMQLKTPKPCIIDIKTKGQNLNSFDSFSSVYVNLDNFTPEIITLKATAKSNALKNRQ
jgi:hypothetical protein